jgi:hypothetical protein
VPASATGPVGDSTESARTACAVERKKGALIHGIVRRLVAEILLHHDRKKWLLAAQRGGKTA